MKRLHVWLLLTSLLVFLCLLAGVAFGQGDEPSFVVVQEIGRAHPRGVIYDQNFDRFAWIDTAGRLVLVNAATYEVEHVLYERGTYTAYTFSHDGRWLALAIDRRVEVWETATGTLSTSLEPDGTLEMQGTLYFAEDDALLVFDAVVPAPEDIRRSENDTALLPWVWDLRDARGEAQSSLPRFVEAYPFFDYRWGVILGPNDLAIAALPNRLQFVNLGEREFPVLGEIETGRLERDPISLWRSLN
ncbi:MAG: hypothetical protein JW910_08780, partial [Anaerolineae bacterium]|nr:hypothetical protein [Anaerolineae bacterium]